MENIRKMGKWNGPNSPMYKLDEINMVNTKKQSMRRDVKKMSKLEILIWSLKMLMRKICIVQKSAKWMKLIPKYNVQN